MATRESGGMGIDHLTVVPENLDVESAVDEESPAPAAETDTADAPETDPGADEPTDGA